MNRKFIIAALVDILIILMLAAGVWYYKSESVELYNSVSARDQKAKDLKAEIAQLHLDSKVKIEAYKDEVVTDLATKCESVGVREPDAAIILDTNGQMSIGSWMFQIKTVQYYVKKFEGRDISRVDAIRIAIDHEKAHDMVKKVLFEVQGGYKEWANCAKKLDLSSKIDVVNRLD